MVDPDEYPLESWEKKAIASLTLKFLAAGALGTIVCLLVARVLQNIGWGFGINTDLLFIPWAVILVLGTSTAFHRGVVDEYQNVTGTKGSMDTGNVKVPYPALMENWEKEAVKKLTLRMILVAVVGTFALIGLDTVLKEMGLISLPSSFLFVPWAISWVMGASTAYRKGVIANRRRLRGRRELDRRLGPRRQAEHDHDKAERAKAKLSAKKKDE